MRRRMCQRRHNQAHIQNRDLCARLQGRSSSLVDIIETQHVGEEDAVEVVFVEEPSEAHPMVERLWLLCGVPP